MKWKKFLKPDWRKIFLTIILVIISLLYFLITPYMMLPMKEIGPWGLCCGLIRGGMESKLHNICFELNITSLEICETHDKQVQFERNLYTILTIVSLIILILFCYILSCLIVWICDKVKKK